MNKSLLAGLFLISFLAFYVLNKSISQQPRVTPNPQISLLPSAKPIISANKTTKPETPAILIIPKIGIEAKVESLGLDRQDKMDVPRQASDVGWYNLGVRPGEIGNSVIDGHLDTVSGAPAVFYKLFQLGKGDEIIVKDRGGKEYKFVVTDNRIYQVDQFPLDEVFGLVNKPRLNLITCDGSFNSQTKNYSHRLVVYSELKL